MNWNAVRQQMEFQLRHVITRGGHLRMHAAWEGSKGVIKAEGAASGDLLLTLHVNQHDGASFIGLALPGDIVRDGMPWDEARRKPIADRAFRINNQDVQGMHRLAQAVDLRVKDYDARRNREAADRAAETLAPAIQELADGSPSDIGAAIAEMLRTMLPAADLDRLRDEVAARASSPRP